MLPEQSGGCITIDCGNLVSDFCRRIQSGENIERFFSNLFYGITAEIHEFTDDSIKRLEEEHMSILIPAAGVVAVSSPHNTSYYNSIYRSSLQ